MAADDPGAGPAAAMRISVITAVYNAGACIAHLAESLRAQSCKDFDWIVIDGGSSDATLAILSEYPDIVTQIVSEADFGIYDALNKGVRRCHTPYYLVAGADDRLDSQCIENYLSAIERTGADVISAAVITTAQERLMPARGNRFRYGHQAYVSQHAVGTLIKTALHDRSGYYSRYFPIAADRYFLLQAIEGVRCSFATESFTAGVFATTGVSSSRVYDSLLDIAKVDFALSRHKRLSTLISMLRLLANLHRL